MAQNRSQVYNVDNRYKQTEGASDNTAGAKFLQRFIESNRQSRFPGIEAERRQDDRFIEAVPLATENTYGKASYRNQFRAAQGEERKYQTIKDTEKTDRFSSLGEMVSENVRSIYDPEAAYTEKVREKYYSR